jgi:hypothetical protein
MSFSPEPRADDHAADAASVATLRDRFCAHYAESARFREDKQLAEALADEAEPVLRALHAACRGPAQSVDLHDAYALLARLCHHAAMLEATASVAVTLPAAILDALHDVHVPLVLTSGQRSELAIVAAEAYCAGRDQRAHRELRRIAAESQVAIALGARCRAIFLSGQHDAGDLAPVLERLARELLRDDIVSCLLDLSRLVPIDEELARAVGGFCAQASTLGLRCTVLTRDARLQEWFTRWALWGPTTVLADQYDRAQGLALAAAGLEMRTRRRWARLFLPARAGLVR